MDARQAIYRGRIAGVPRYDLVGMTGGSAGSGSPLLNPGFLNALLFRKGQHQHHRLRHSHPRSAIPVLPSHSQLPTASLLLCATMLASILFGLGAMSVSVNGHYNFPKVLVGNAGGQDWQYVRRADNWQDNGFVGNVNSDQIRCFQATHQGAP